ncbi:MAG: hypothetical protein IKN57_09655 [Parasporobacterium sp.]|nr:hypothetical protein [Parasporobacterium sp.]MBR3643761.1 hypothetical protein [Parasporobacterium sp.]
MSREHSEARRRFKSMCRKREQDEKVLLDRTKMLLKTYRGTGWSVMERPAMEEEIPDSDYQIRPEIFRAIDYLESFDPEKDKDDFEDRLEPLFETSWIQEIVSMTMNKVREFPCYGSIYYSILNDCFFSAFKYTEREMVELMKMERSVYYDRKKEAIMTFAVALWNTAVPKIRSFEKESGVA